MKTYDRDQAADALQQIDLSRYSIMRALRSICSRNVLDGVEREVSDLLAATSGIKPRGFYCPLRVLATGSARRALDTSTGAGASKVATAEEAIDLLRPLCMLSRMGAVVMDGLVGSFFLPRQTAGTSMQWLLPDAAAPTASNPAYGDQVQMVPHFLSGTVDITRSFLAQSSIAAETLLRSDLFKQAAVSVDQGGINGSGASGQPLGLLNNSSIAIHSLGTDGAIPGWADIIQLMTDVDNQNVEMTSAGWLASPLAAGLLKITEKQSGYPRYLMEDGKIAGVPAFVSNVCPSNLSKGSGANLSALLYGSWNSLILGMWSNGIDISVNPYTLSSSGGIRISLHIACDIEARNPQAFSAFKDIDTSSIAPNS